MVRGVLDARSEAEVQVELAKLAAHQYGAWLARALRQYGDALFYDQFGDNPGLCRVAPEWPWRDYRLRLSHGRSHGTDRRMERAGLVWGIYRNFEPAQGRCARQRKYRHPSQCPLAMAGVPPGEVSYLDALGV